MNIVRIYSGKDGKSHFEDQTLAVHPTKENPQAASRIFFRAQQTGSDMGYHPAPRRQYIIIISGQLEIGLEDGTKRIFGPGDARLVEDTTGKGHTSKVVSNEPVVTAVIPLV